MIFAVMNVFLFLDDAHSGTFIIGGELMGHDGALIRATTVLLSMNICECVYDADETLLCANNFFLTQFPFGISRCWLSLVVLR